MRLNVFPWCLVGCGWAPIPPRDSAGEGGGGGHLLPTADLELDDSLLLRLLRRMILRAPWPVVLHRVRLCLAVGAGRGERARGRLHLQPASAPACQQPACLHARRRRDIGCLSRHSRKGWWEVKESVSKGGWG